MKSLLTFSFVLFHLIFSASDAFFSSKTHLKISNIETTTVLEQKIEVTKSKTKSGFDALDISFDVHSDLQTFIDVLIDVDNYNKWVYGCSFAKELKATNSENTAYHTLLDFPFPFADRAVYVETKKYYLADNIFVAESSSNPKLFEETKNVIIKDYFSQWKVTVLNENLLHIDYRAEVNPNDNIPAWLYNLAATKGPTETMRKLTQKVEAKSL